MVLIQRGGGGPTSSREWVSIETLITCDFPGGVRTPEPPPLDPHVGSPDATVCLQVYQNLNKTEKYHPTTARKKSGHCFFWSSIYFTVYRVDPMVLIQRGGGGPTSSREWVSIETLITCDFPGGVRTPEPPPLDPHVGSPDATVCLQVYQNLNKTEKYHPTTTKRKKAISCWSR